MSMNEFSLVGLVEPLIWSVNVYLHLKEDVAGMSQVGLISFNYQLVPNKQLHSKLFVANLSAYIK